MLDIERILVLTLFGDIGQKKNEVAGDLFLSRNLVKSSFGIGRLLAKVGPIFYYLISLFPLPLTITNMNTKYLKKLSTVKEEVERAKYGELIICP